ncbi:MULTISPECIES: hypothetical protein [unclassified Pseudomonas]|uniref:hypothetical protein n=1 Tax=Pseudomonas sp. R16(2017) TaxID=1981704 RepID=UPI000A1E99E3|nr:MULTISPECIES: hypothetical protein [unclassified Pseudomonas]
MVPSPNPTVRTRPTMASHRLDLPSRCDICGEARSTRKHQACSRIRQRRKAAEWAELMAERAEAKKNKPRRFKR